MRSVSWCSTVCLRLEISMSALSKDMSLYSSLSSSQSWPQSQLLVESYMRRSGWEWDNNCRPKNTTEAIFGGTSASLFLMATTPQDSKASLPLCLSMLTSQAWHARSAIGRRDALDARLTHLIRTRDILSRSCWGTLISPASGMSNSMSNLMTRKIKHGKSTSQSSPLHLS